MSRHGPLRIGIGGPVGSGKTTLIEMLCKAMRESYSVAVITNDIYTKEDALILNRVQALPEDRIMGVETGGCPHTAIREDASINLSAIAAMNARHQDLDIIFIESGGDNLAATFFAGSGRHHALCHQRVPGRKNSAQRRPGDQPLGSSHHQQDGSCAACERAA